MDTSRMIIVVLVIMVGFVAIQLKPKAEPSGNPTIRKVGPL